MKFFQRPPVDAPLAAAAPPPPPAVERRRYPRFAPHPDFPLKAVLGFVGRDDAGAPLSASRHGWNWKGRLIDCSEIGARIQLGAGMRAEIGEKCDLRLSVGSFEFVVPCHVTNLRENGDGVVFGVRHEFPDEETWRVYHQLVEVLALASTLSLKSRTPRPDASGYNVERFAGARPASLTVWRHPDDGTVWAFEFVLEDNLVRAARGQSVEYFAGDPTGSQPATASRSLEIHRLYQWVVANLPPALAPDIRAFLAHYDS